MVNYMDSAVGKFVHALKSRANMWNNTLLVLFSDNGGPIYNPGSANNFPLRGGKYSDWEGDLSTFVLCAELVPPRLICLETPPYSVVPYLLRHSARTREKHAGGIRTNAFISGGWVPENMRGTAIREMISVADW